MIKQVKVRTFVFLALAIIGSLVYFDVQGSKSPTTLSRNLPSKNEGERTVTSSIRMPKLAWAVVESDLFSMHATVAGSNRDSLWLERVEVVPEEAIPGVQIAPGVSPDVYLADNVLASSLRIGDFDSLGTERLFVMGHPIRRGGIVDESKTLIEQWTLTYPDGSPTASIETTVDTIGTPIPELGWFFNVQGGVYMEPSTRGRLRVKKEIVAELPGNVTCLEVDPDGRYLLYGQQGIGVWQIDLATGSIGLPPLLALSAVDYPFFEEVYSLKFRRTVSGQKTLIATVKSSMIAYCPDANNDGVFESAAAMHGMDSVYAGLEDSSAWETSYTFVSFP